MNILKEIQDFIRAAYSKQQDPMEPVQEQQTIPTAQNPDVLISDWIQPSNAYHNVRVLCDLAGLTLAEKNLICACIYQESRFNNAAVCRNKNSLGQLTSSDWGVCQVNDHYHIGPTLDFPSVEYVLDNPGSVVNWMIKMYQAGKLTMWVSFSSGAYRQWLVDSSPMWLLITALHH